MTVLSLCIKVKHEDLLAPDLAVWFNTLDQEFSNEAALKPASPSARQRAASSSSSCIRSLSPLP